MSEWFAIPDVSFQDLAVELTKMGRTEVIADLLEGRDQKQMVGVGLGVVAMGWSWAVFLAQEALMGVVAKAGSRIQEVLKLDQNPLGNSLAMVEGGPPPTVSVQFPLHFEYVDDFGVIQFYQEDQTGSRSVEVESTLDFYKKVIIEEMQKLNLPVHEEEEGVVSTLLGMEVGGTPPVVRPSLEKQWMSYEVQWEIGRSGKSRVAVVESIVALTTWLFMVMRCGLSVYQEVYHWIRLFREKNGILEVPMAVRKELLAAAVAVLLVGQDLTMSWNQTVYLFDASEEGGGICSTDASWEEITKESRWGVRGGWTKFIGDQDYFEHYRAEELAPEKIMIVFWRFLRKKSPHIIFCTCSVDSNGSGTWSGTWFV